MAGSCTLLAGLLCFLVWVFAKGYGVLLFFAFVVGTVSGKWLSLLISPVIYLLFELEASRETLCDHY